MRVSPHVRANITPDGVMFLDITGGRLYTANRIGAHIWQRLDEGWADAEIAREIASEYHADAGVIHCDVARFVAELASRGFLIDERPASAAGAAQP